MGACALDFKHDTQHADAGSDAGQTLPGIDAGRRPDAGDVLDGGDDARVPVGDDGAAPNTPDASREPADAGFALLDAAPDDTSHACGSTTCQHGGTCAGSGASATCVCPATFRGPQCESDVDECLGSDHGCTADFPCDNRVGGFVCLGQHADFPLPARSSTANAVESGYTVDVSRGTVLDTQTGLMWTLYLAGNRDLTWLSANAYCNDSTQGDHDDWRLPYVHEASTLFNLEQVPAFPTTVFPDQTREQNGNSSFWLQGYAQTDSGRFRYEWEGYWSRPPGEDVQSNNPATTAAVRCVRIEKRLFSGPPSARYVAHEGAELITDLATRLTWRRVPLSAGLADAVASQCAAFSTPTRTFRLPTLVEELSLVDPATHRPSLTYPFTLGDDCDWTSSLMTRDQPARAWVDLRDFIWVNYESDARVTCRGRCVTSDVVD